MGKTFFPSVHIFVPIMLQKPSKKSKAKDHAKYLIQRLEKWAQGDLAQLLNECDEIQSRLAKAKAKKDESRKKAFCRLMLASRINQACKFIDNNDSITGVHKITDQKGFG